MSCACTPSLLTLGEELKQYVLAKYATLENVLEGVFIENAEKFLQVFSESLKESCVSQYCDALARPVSAIR